MKNIIKVFAYLLLGISLLLLFFSLNFINKWNKQNNQISKQLDEINDLVKIEKVEDNENTIVKDESSTLKNTNLNNVDFSELKNKNSDVVGWIDVKGTNINYPFVQYTDNNFYLTHSFDKKYNDAGWLFEDYRNDGFNDKNTIIYAHSRLDKTMFGSLKNTLKQEWINDKENYIYKFMDKNQQQKLFLKNEEFMLYTKILLSLILLIILSLLFIDKFSFFDALTHGVFQVVSFQSGGGFSSIDYTKFNEFAKVILLIAMALGACAGSTCGGIKIVRFLVVFKYINTEIKKIIHPNAVYPIRINNQIVPKDVMTQIIIFICFNYYFFVYLKLIITCFRYVIILMFHVEH